MLGSVSSDWVDASGDPIDSEGAGPAPGQLELSMPGTPPLLVPAPPAIRFWRTSLAAADLEDCGSFDYSLAPELFLDARAGARCESRATRTSTSTSAIMPICSSTSRNRTSASRIRQSMAGMPWRSSPSCGCSSCGARGTSAWIHFERQATDSRKPTARFDVDERLGHIQELNAGWAHVIPTESAGLPLGAPLSLPGLPASTDGELVALAIQSGCHAFLTGDLRVHRLSVRTRPLGLTVLAPTGLIAVIDAAGEMTPVGAEGGVCDDHKVVHLQRVVDPDNAG